MHHRWTATPIEHNITHWPSCVLCNAFAAVRATGEGLVQEIGMCKSKAHCQPLFICKPRASRADCHVCHSVTVGFTWLQLAMLHLLHQACGLRAAQQALYVPQTCAKANSTDPNPPPKTLRALCELIRVLGSLPVQRPPFAGAATHVAGGCSTSKALQTLVLLSTCTMDHFLEYVSILTQCRGQKRNTQ